MFLADKTVLGQLKATYPELNLSELNKKKGAYWRETVKASPELLAVYQAQADEANKHMNKVVIKVVEPTKDIVEEITEEIVETTPPPPSPTKVCPPAPKKAKKTKKSKAKKSSKKSTQ